MLKTGRMAHWLSEWEVEKVRRTSHMLIFQLFPSFTTALWLLLLPLSLWRWRESASGAKWCWWRGALMRTTVQKQTQETMMIDNFRLNSLRWTIKFYASSPLPVLEWTFCHSLQTSVITLHNKTVLSMTPVALILMYCPVKPTHEVMSISSLPIHQRSLRTL